MDHEFRIAIDRIGTVQCADCEDYITFFSAGDYLESLLNDAEAHECT
jgi:hypothetical protein